eukprot:s193_g31.t2
MVWKERVRVLKVKFPKIPKAFRARAAYQTTCTVPVKREKCVRLGELNPENLTPDSAEVKMDVLVGKLVDLPSKASRRRDRRARGLETMGRRWEYEARGAFKAFEDDCQGEVERLFQEYQSGGQQRVTVKTGKIEISLDFKLMTSKAILGARPRTTRPEESDFDPNVPRRTAAAQSGPGPSSGTVDLAELKRRIHGAGNWPRMAAWMAWAQDFAKERPRVAFGIFATVLMLAMFGSIYISTRSTSPPAEQMSTTGAADIVLDVEPLTTAAPKESSWPKVTGSKDVQAVIDVVRKDNSLLRAELSSLRQELQDIKQLLRGGAPAAVSGATAAASVVPKEAPVAADDTGEIHAGGWINDYCVTEICNAWWWVQRLCDRYADSDFYPPPEGFVIAAPTQLTGLKMLSQRQCARTMRGAKGHEVLAILRVMCKVCLVKIDVGDPHESPSPMFVTFALAPYVYLFWLRHPSGYRHQPVADAQKATGVAKLQSLAEIIRVTTPESCNWLRGSHPQ